MTEQYKNAIELFIKIFGKCENNYTGDQIKVNCPNCAKLYNDYNADSKFNLEINLESKKYHCWKCGIKGLDLKFLIKIYGKNPIYISQYEDIFLFERFEKFFNRSRNVVVDSVIDNEIRDLPSEFIAFGSKEFDIDNHKHHTAYIYVKNDRKLSDDILKKYNIGFCTSGKYKNRIIFPSYDIYNNLNYYVTRTYVGSKIKYENSKFPKLDIIINEKFISFNDTLYLVEGFFDYFAFPLNTAIILEKKIHGLLFERIIKYKPNLVFLLDPDAINDVFDNIDRLELYGYTHDKIKYVLFNENLDIDEYKIKYGETALLDKISKMERIDKLFSFRKNKYFLNDK